LLGRPRHLPGRGGQPDDELAAMPGPLAERVDGAAVKLDQAAHQREADPEAALRTIRQLIALDEELEHRREPLGRDASPVVAHADDHLAALTPAVHLDVA